MSGREAPLYLNLWSLPSWEALSTADSGWTWLEGLPVYRLAVEGAGGRAWQLLEAVVAPVRELLLQARPEALLLGTARGEVGFLLESFAGWQEGEGISPLLSPETSGGTLASRLARSLEISGPAWVVSQTCLSGLLALYQAALLVREAQTVLFGAVEAPLHPFLVRMMAALRLYTPRRHYPYVQPGAGEGNTFALGEGVALGLLSQKPISPFQLLAVRVATAPPQERACLHSSGCDRLRSALAKHGDSSAGYGLLARTWHAAGRHRRMASRPKSMGSAARALCESFFRA